MLVLVSLVSLNCMAQSKVYYTNDITPKGLIKVYEALGREAKGRVAVKISTGEPGGHNFLQPALIGGLVKKVKEQLLNVTPLIMASVLQLPTT